MDERAALTHVLALAARLCREDPFAGGAGELCGKLAQLGAARGLALYALHAEGPEAELLGAYGLPADYVRRYPPGARRPLNQLTGDLREALRRGRTLVVAGLAEDPRTVSLTSVARQGRFHVSVSVPLRFEAHTVGLLHAFYGSPSAVARGDLLSRALPIVTSALSRERLRARLAKHAEDEAPGDHPSGIYSRAALLRGMRHVHAAADRYEMKYTVVVYSLDHPRELETQYGAGLIECAVQQLAIFVAEECRRADQAGVLDGVDCAAVLPGTSQRGAFTQAERVIQRFCRFPFKYGDERLQLSVSAGLSSFPANGALDAEAALTSARDALDGARRNGDERVVAIAAVGSATPDEAAETLS